MFKILSAHSAVRDIVALLILMRSEHESVCVCERGRERKRATT